MPGETTPLLLWTILELPLVVLPYPVRFKLCFLLCLAVPFNVFVPVVNLLF